MLAHRFAFLNAPPVRCSEWYPDENNPRKELFMSSITKAFGWALTAFGVFVVVRSKQRHITGLFPGLIGLLLVAFGFASEKESQASAATAAAGVVALAGVLVPVQGIAFPDLFPSTAADDQPHPDRRVAQAGTALLCGIYLLFAVSARLLKKRGG